MKSKLIIGALLITILGGAAIPQAFADGASDDAANYTRTADPDAGIMPISETTTNTPTSLDNDVEAELFLGHNLFLAGNNINGRGLVNGLLFSAGNQLDLEHDSEYAFLAGNNIIFEGATQKDLFAAGNNINIVGQVGRDAFIAGNTISVLKDLPGDLYVTGSRLVLKDIEIAGNANLSVEQLIIEGNVEVTGKLSLNEDAGVTGMSSLKYGELERYEVVDYEYSTADYWLGRLISITGLFIAFAIILAMFPRINQKITKELNVSQFGKDLLIGMCTLLFTPFIVVFLLMSLVGAPAGIVLLGIYVITIYLAQGFSGLYLGKFIIEKLLKVKLNGFAEALLGIVLLGLLAMIPGIGWVIGLISLLLGLGLFMQCIKPKRDKKTPHAPVVFAPIAEAETIETTKEQDSHESAETVSETEATEEVEEIETDTDISEAKSAKPKKDSD